MKTAKERPIRFQAPMVRAILDGRKTQTRRIVKPQPPSHIDELHGGKLSTRAPYDIKDDEQRVCGWGFQDDCSNYWKCPYRIGMKRWVREACKATASDEGIDCIHYAADDYCRAITSNEIEKWRKMRSYAGGVAKQITSIHMPRWVSRITLEVVSVRVERLQDISEADAMAEGCEPGCLTCGENCLHTGGCGQCLPCYCESFIWLWQSINGFDSWAANPWVWVIEFRRCDQ